MKCIRTHTSSLPLHRYLPTRGADSSRTFIAHMLPCSALQLLPVDRILAPPWTSLLPAYLLTKCSVVLHCIRIPSFTHNHRVLTRAASNSITSAPPTHLAFGWATLKSHALKLGKWIREKWTHQCYNAVKSITKSQCISWIWQQCTLYKSCKIILFIFLCWSLATTSDTYTPLLLSYALYLHRAMEPWSHGVMESWRQKQERESVEWGCAHTKVTCSICL